MSALDHIRVLDLTHYRAGPFCTKLLAEYGADVVKVERPESGDPSRGLGPFPCDIPDPDLGGLFRFLNANKRGITLDLKSETGKDLLKTLVATADVVVENFAPSTREALGITYESLAAIQPKIVLTSISNFGQTGPRRDWQATDLIEYAAGGLMYLIGMNDREPLRHGVAQAEFLAGALAATATLTSHLGAQLQGEGDHVDVSIQESVASGLQASLLYYGYMGATRWRRKYLISDMTDVFPCADGYVVPGAGGFSDWETYTTCIGAPELNSDRFSTAGARQLNGKEFAEIIEKSLAAWGRKEIFHRGQEWGFPFGVVQTPEDLIDCPQLEARAWWRPPDERDGLRLPGPVFRMTESPAGPVRPAPRLGEHNSEVWGALGFSVADLAGFRERGVM